MVTRQLEIGPTSRMPGFETLDLIARKNVDHVADCRALPFPAGSFSLVYASHVIEHLPWYETDAVLAEWGRVLAPGGALELWTVNAYVIAKALVQLEETGEWTGAKIGPWKEAWIDGDPYRWASGRIFCYSKSGRADDPYWHHAMFTPRSLQAACTRAGFASVRIMDRAEVRGRDHGWFNLGVRAERAC